MTHACGRHLSECQCPDVLTTLRNLAGSDYVYVGNIIDARIRDGLNTREQFDGVDIYHPFDGPLGEPYLNPERLM